MLAASLFARIDDLGLRTIHLEPTPAAIARGVAEAFWWSEHGYGRGERASASLTQQSLRFLMINRTPRESLPATARSA